jgi:hypothetical protein
MISKLRLRNLGLALLVGTEVTTLCYFRSLDPAESIMTRSLNLLERAEKMEAKPLYAPYINSPAFAPSRIPRDTPFCVFAKKITWPKLVVRLLSILAGPHRRVD